MRSIEMKGCTGTKRVMPGPHIHAFMSLKFVYLIFQAQMRFFFLIWAIIHFIGTVIVKKKLLSQYLATVIMRGFI